MTAAARHSLRRREEGVSLSLCRVAACAVSAGQLNCFVRRRFFFGGGEWGGWGYSTVKCPYLVHLLNFATFFHCLSWIRILDPDPTFFYPGSKLFPSWIPDPHQKSPDLSGIWALYGTVSSMVISHTQESASFWRLKETVLRIRIRCLFDPWIRDPE